MIQEHEALTEEQGRYVDRYFRDNVYPVLTPMAVDSSRPFPLIRNKTLNIGERSCLKRIQETQELGVCHCSGSFRASKIVRLPDSKDGSKNVILLEEIIERNMKQLFLSYDIVCSAPYRVMRNADLTIEEDEKRPIC